MNRMSQKRLTHFIYYFFLNPEPIILYYVLYFLIEFIEKASTHPGNFNNDGDLKNVIYEELVRIPQKLLSRTEVIFQALFSECYYGWVSV